MSIIIPAGAGGSGLTFQEMIDQVVVEIRNTSIPTVIGSWLNIAIIEVASEFVFGVLHKYSSKGTVPSMPEILLDEDFLWLKTVEIPARQIKLYPEDEQRLAESFPDYRTKTGTVTHYYVNGRYMGLYQVPTDIEQVTFSYQRRPFKLSVSTDVCELPSEWHGLIIQRAISKGYSSEGNTEGYARSEERERLILKRLGRLAYRRLDETSVLGGPTTRRRPPRPRMPSNFPASRW